MKATLLAALLVFTADAQAEEDSLRAEVAMLRAQLTEMQAHIEQLETTVSLLMAGYQHDRKMEVYRDVLPEVVAP